MLLWLNYDSFIVEVEYDLMTIFYVPNYFKLYNRK